MIRSSAAAFTMLLVCVSPNVSSQGYPAKPIRVIDAYPPGGSTDVLARLVAPKFQEATGQPWVIENRPGAQGIIDFWELSDGTELQVIGWVTATHLLVLYIAGEVPQGVKDVYFQGVIMP